MPTFQRSDEVDEIIQDLIDSKPYHEALKETGVTIDVLMYYGEDDEPLKLRGRNVGAYVKANTKKERALGLRDATIVFDANHWKDLSDLQKAALADHELYHLAVALDKDQAPKKDDLGRPILRMRQHDIEVGWFRQIAAEHGDNAPEIMDARALIEKDGQIFFGFMAGQTKPSGRGRRTVHKDPPLEVVDQHAEGEEHEPAAAAV